MIDVRRQWTLVVIGGVLGALIGCAAWLLVLSFSHATFIVSIGQVQQGISSGTIGQQVKLDPAFLEDPSAFAERVRSPAFASSIAQRTGLAELVETLPARQYGGRGMLSVRSLRAPAQGLPNLIELRISSLSSDVARAAARAASEQIIEEHAKLLEPFMRAMKGRGELLQEQLAVLRKSDEELDRKFAKLAPGQQSDTSDAVLLAAKLMSEKRALDVELTAYEGRLAILSQDTRKTMVLFEPAVSTPRKAWAFLAPISGAIAVMIFVFLALRVWQEFATRRARLLASEVD
ncbi:hypothetical protein [Tardiphaga sp.]|uniref:hypothetical protein n=1 Tax=Tardiphaga sp. TaxID=1926292 RepID=UPI00260E1F4A|nr:hypothetical protein [Tardiphaga sp.]MDB5619755.1 hypothetical protein [Tardiphaga sp.]